MSDKLRRSELKEGMQRELLNLNTKLLKSESESKDKDSEIERLRCNLWEAEAALDLKNRTGFMDVFYPVTVAALFFFVGMYYGSI
jgi:hypothetical protein